MFTPDPDLFNGFALRDWLEEFDSMKRWDFALANVVNVGVKMKLGIQLETMKIQALPKGNKSMGDCSYKGQIRMSPFSFENREGYVDTLRHEVAHMFNAFVDEEMGHGKYWRRWARRLGANDRAKAKDDVFWDSAGWDDGKRTIAQCLGCGHELMRKRRSDVTGAGHRGCGGKFINVFKDAEEQVKFLHYRPGILAGSLDGLRE